MQRYKIQETRSKQATRNKFKTKQIQNKKTMENGDKVYDLEERTLKFSKEIIHLIKGIPRNAINHPIFS